MVIKRKGELRVSIQLGEWRDTETLPLEEGRK